MLAVQEKTLDRGRATVLEPLSLLLEVSLHLCPSVSLAALLLLAGGGPARNGTCKTEGSRSTAWIYLVSCC